MEHIHQDQNFDRTAHNRGRTYIILGWVLAVASIFFYPFILGTLGVLMGVIAKRKGAKGNAVIIANILFALIGLMISALILTLFRTYLSVMTIIY
ncbi:MAG: hypothetical protein PWP27_2126 [Clostridiales bacterium]|nr:hypothetical protein [Clostridiales bacterium]MDK2934316.1 hypothetical protein [Clostridiales bacterium]